MSQPDESGDKQFEPTQKKLADAKKKGEVPRSGDLTTAASYGGLILASAGVGAIVLSGLGAQLAGILERSPELASDVFSGGRQAKIGAILATVALWVSVWFILPALGAMVSIAAQRSFTVTPSKLKAKASRVSILANAKNKFGRQGLFEFAKSLAKLVIFGVVLGAFLVNRLPEILVTSSLNAGANSVLLLDLSLSFMKTVFLVALTIGGIDLFWQRAEHLRKNRMSRKDMADEAKQTEGDPHTKQQRRQRGQEIALNQMLADVPKADVVIVNPQHYAIALVWNRAPGSAPVCVAKGVDEIAARIREAANKNGIPIHHDPPTARALFATVALGEQIWPEHFHAVAAAIRFAEEMGKRSKEWKKRNASST